MAGKRFGMEPISWERADGCVYSFHYQWRRFTKTCTTKVLCELIQGWKTCSCYTKHAEYVHTTDYSETSIVAKIYTELLACSRTWWTVSVRKRETKIQCISGIVACRTGGVYKGMRVCKIAEAKPMPAEKKFLWCPQKFDGFISGWSLV